MNFCQTLRVDCHRRLKRSGIYLIRNLVNGKVYIGSAVSLYHRRLDHIWALRKGRHRNPKLQRSWNRHGESSFWFDVLLVCDKGDLIFFEQKALDVFSASYGWGHIYNLSPTAGSSLGVRFTDETKAKIGAKSKGRNLGRKHTLEELQKMSESNRQVNLGRKHSLETRLKMSRSGKGRKFSEEHKARIGAALRGQKRPPEVVEKWASKLRGRKLSPERLAKIGRKGSKKGRKLSDATRAKMSQSRRDYYARIIRQEGGSL